jgi:hypothetical protein
MNRSLPFPVRSVPLGADVLVRIQALEDAAAGDQLVLDVRLYQRSPEDVSAIAFCATSAGLRIPLHLSDLVTDAMRHVATRAAEQLAMAPPRPR